MTKQQGICGNEAGVSLVEIMVALFILGLTASLVVISLPTRGDDANTLAATLVAATETARERAYASGSAHGVYIREDGARVLVWRDGQWREIADQKTRISGNGDTGFQSLEILGGPVPVTVDLSDRRTSTDEATAAFRPDIWFDPSGIATQTRLKLAGERVDMTLNVARSGEIDLVPSS